MQKVGIEYFNEEITAFELSNFERLILVFLKLTSASND